MAARPRTQLNGVRLAALEVPGGTDRWAALGFSLDGEGRIPLRNGAIVPGADRMRLMIDADRVVLDSLDGVGTGPGELVDPTDHPNGAMELDHVVVMTDSIERTSAAIEHVLGLEQRRVRETPTVRQAFHRFDDQGGTRGCIIEVVENPRIVGTALWGVVVNVVDLDELHAQADGLVGAPKPAVQSRRRIATVRAPAGLGTAVAFMSMPDSW